MNGAAEDLGRAGHETAVTADDHDLLGTVLNLAPNKRTMTTDSSTKFVGAAKVSTSMYRAGVPTAVMTCASGALLETALTASPE